MFLRLPGGELDDFDVLASSRAEAQEKGAERLDQYPSGTAIIRVAERPLDEIY